LLAARRGLKGITLAELEEARDKVRWGKERRSLALSEKEKQNTAYHEAGHALLLELLPHTEPLHKVTIIPRGPSLGSTMWLPEEDKYTNRKNELLAGLAVSMGGRVAEEIIFGDITNGARGDIKMATAIARRMVCEWGMSEKMGMVEYGDHEITFSWARHFACARLQRSDCRADRSGSEKLLDDAYRLAKHSLRIAMRWRQSQKHCSDMKPDGSQIKEIVEHGRLINSPGARRPANASRKTARKPSHLTSPRRPRRTRRHRRFAVLDEIFRLILVRPDAALSDSSSCFGVSFQLWHLLRRLSHADALTSRRRA
jgi:cell division protease FtsH